MRLQTAYYVWQRSIESERWHQNTDPANNMRHKTEGVEQTRKIQTSRTAGLQVTFVSLFWCFENKTCSFSWQSGKETARIFSCRDLEVNYIHIYIKNVQTDTVLSTGRLAHRACAAALSFWDDGEAILRRKRAWLKMQFSLQSRYIYIYIQRLR